MQPRQGIPAADRPVDAEEDDLAEDPGLDPADRHTRHPRHHGLEPDGVLGNELRLTFARLFHVCDIVDQEETAHTLPHEGLLGQDRDAPGGTGRRRDLDSRDLIRGERHRRDGAVTWCGVVVRDQRHCST